MSELSRRSEVVFPSTELSAEIGKLNFRDVRDISSYKPYIYIPVQTTFR
jgi:hypothetical protein